MRPKKHKTTGSNDLFRARLDQIINLKHELVLLAGKIDWDWIDGAGYAHAKQFKRHRRQLRTLRSQLGRIIRDIRRKVEGQDAFEKAFALPLAGPRKSARSSSASTAGSCIPSMPRRWSASARARPAHLTSSG